MESKAELEWRQDISEARKAHFGHRRKVEFKLRSEFELRDQAKAGLLSDTSKGTKGTVKGTHICT